VQVESKLQALLCHYNAAMGDRQGAGETRARDLDRRAPATTGLTSAYLLIADQSLGTNVD
jgi:hypothetical protein